MGGEGIRQIIRSCVAVLKDISPAGEKAPRSSEVNEKTIFLDTAHEKLRIWHKESILLTLPFWTSISALLLLPAV